MRHFKNNNDVIFGYDDDQQDLVDAAIEAGYEVLSKLPVITPEPINYTRASKRKMMDKLRELDLWASIKAYMVADDDMWDDWLASQDLAIDDPAVILVRDSKGWTQQQLQDLFNALNA